MLKVPVSTLARKKSEYLKMAHEGRKFLITKRGKPWVILGPILPEVRIRKSRKQTN
jgi:prevent-host-death family protein